MQHHYPTVTADQLLAELAHHKGQAKGIHVRELAMRLHKELAVTGAHERAVRRLVNDLRLDGQPICAHPAHGYFLAETPAELEHTCAFLRARAMCSLKAESRLRKLSLPALLYEAAAKAERPESKPFTESHTQEEQFYDGQF